MNGFAYSFIYSLKYNLLYNKKSALKVRGGNTFPRYHPNWSNPSLGPLSEPNRQLHQLHLRGGKKSFAIKPRTNRLFSSCYTFRSPVIDLFSIVSFQLLAVVYKPTVHCCQWETILIKNQYSYLISSH